MNTESIIRTKLNEILDHIGISPDVFIDGTTEEDTINVFIEGKDLNFLIGYRGQSLDALQNLLNLIVYNETGDWNSIIVDINGYRDVRNERLEDMVRNHIDRVRFSSGEVSLPPMSSFERRQVHLFVSEYDDIESESFGRGSGRYVVLRPGNSFVVETENESEEDFEESL